MKYRVYIIVLVLTGCVSIRSVFGQVPVDLRGVHGDGKGKAGVAGDHDAGEATARVQGKELWVEWPAGVGVRGRIVLNLLAGRPLIARLGLKENTVAQGEERVLMRGVDPAFLLRVGKRDLVTQNGWNIFFDKVPLKPYRSYRVIQERKHISVESAGARTVIKVDGERAGDFSGRLEITLFHGEPLLNMAAVLLTQKDSTAILYDAGLVSRYPEWARVEWSDMTGVLQGKDVWEKSGRGEKVRGKVAPGAVVREKDSCVTEAVKYRAILGMGAEGGVAVFPAPHQYFYPLDEAFNLRFVWHGRYDSLLPGYGIGIRQDPQGDHRYVPWFNAPPGTEQRLNFFCLLGASSSAALLDNVKAYTHDDRYVPLDGYKTFSSHFHNEFISRVVLAGKPVPEVPDFAAYFRGAGINIVHLAEFHGMGHPKGPGGERWKELDALFRQCRRLSDKQFLLLPGEEPNEFFGGHWLALFPHPVFWVMSHPAGVPFVEEDSVYGKLYHIGDADEMKGLLDREGGLVWTAHPRTKGSTGFPDAYRVKDFYLSRRWLGGAWKALPADLSQPRLGKRVLDLMDDMNNWGLDKRVLAEADLFSINGSNEMYAHMNVNYLRLRELPDFDAGWGAVLDSLRRGRFFSTTGEVLIPDFTVGGVGAGDTVRLGDASDARIRFTIRWTFPLSFAELVSGDGEKVYRHRIPLDDTRAFGERSVSVGLDLRGRRWVRLEVWDAAADGAFTQTVRLQP